MREHEAGEHAKQRAQRRRGALPRRTCHEVHDHRSEQTDRGKGNPARGPSRKRQRHDQLPDDKAAEEKAEQRLRARPAPKHAQEQTEGPEHHAHPAQAPMVARDERLPWFRAVGRNHDHRHVADPEHLVDVQLRADLVVRSEGLPLLGAIEHLDLKMLGSIVEHPELLDVRIVDRRHACTRGHSPLHGDGPRGRHQPEPHADQREDQHGDGIPPAHGSTPTSAGP